MWGLSFKIITLRIQITADSVADEIKIVSVHTYI